MISFLARNRSFAVLVLLVGCCFVLILATSGVGLGRPKSFAENAVALIQGVITGTSRWVRSTFNSIGELREAREELVAAQARLREAERISRDIVRLRRENAQLRELLDLSESVGHRNVPAQVIAKQPGNTAPALVLNKGSRDGVEPFMPVVAQQGGVTGLVGKVVSVGSGSSTVLPIIGENSYVAVRLDESRYDGLLVGLGEGSSVVQMRHVSKLAIKEIGYGEMVVTSGLGSVFPSGIHVGRVRTVRSVPHEPSLELELEPLIDISRLEFVLILVPEE